MCAAMGMLVLPTAHAGEDYPLLRPGMWQFTASIEPGPAGKRVTGTTLYCSNPIEELRRQQQRFSRGCEFTSLERRGTAISYRGHCSIQGVSHEWVISVSADSDTTFTQRIEHNSEGRSEVEIVKAKRTGDCKDG